uniref:Uncharacterized protein n=1 Tax=Panagrolaimus sp. JU765 TaxID=591449 RepID=A0AC34Q8A1_9BILA
MRNRIILSSNVKVDGEIVVLTLSVDDNKQVCFKVEKNDEGRTLIAAMAANVPLSEWKDYRPRFFFGKDYCSVNYYKHGLSWKLKDVNGNIKIPFKISFGEEIYVGDAASDFYGCFSFNMDLETMMDEENTSKSKSESNENGKIVVQTVDGPRITTLENILAVFMKSILKLLEEKLEKSVEEIYLNVPRSTYNTSLLKGVCKRLKIQFELLNLSK